MNKKSFTTIAIVIVLVILVGIAGYAIGTQQIPRISLPWPTPGPVPIVPIPTSDGEQITLQEGQRADSFLLEKVYSDYVSGLNFLEYPVPMERGYPVTLHIGQSVGNGCTVTLTLVRIQGNAAIFTRDADFNKNIACPICLAKNTLISGPSGAIAVQDLQRGDEVWTVDTSGKRIAVKILQTVRTPAPLNHQVVHLILEDGREFFVSPGHPTGDGRPVGDFSSGDVIDGARVASAKKVLYQKGYTYDILPAGETGLYWANGILIGSTLFYSQ